MADGAANTPETLHNPNDEKLKAIFTKIVRLEKEKASVASEIKDVYSEAKADGYNTKLIRKAIARAKKNAEELRLEDEELPVYMLALEKTKESF